MSIINTIKIDDVEYVRKDSVIEIPEISENFVIVRCKNAGVHFGELVHRDAETVVLKNSRRLWRWWSKFSLSGLAMEGPIDSKINEQRYACILPKIVLTTSDVCEVIHCSNDAAKKIVAVKEWKNE